MIYRVANPYSKGSAFGLWNDLYHDGTCGNQSFFGLENFGFICELGNPDIKVYTVSFDTQGGSIVESQKVPGNSKAVKPTQPTRSGYTFGGWYKDSALTQAWNFSSDVVTSDITLYAKWVADQSSFVIGEDNNHFGHYPSNFFANGIGKYLFKNSAFYSLLEKFYPKSKTYLQSWVKDDWGGSCFGIASTIGLVKLGKLSINDITSSGAINYHGLNAPVKDVRLFDSINFYHVGQSLFRGKALINYTEKDDKRLKAFLKSLVDSTKDEKLVLFTYKWYDSEKGWVGHAIVALDSRYDETNDQYIVTMYDENTASGTPTNNSETEHKAELFISSDYSSFSYRTASGFMLEDEYLRMEILDLNKFPVFSGQDIGESSQSLGNDKVIISISMGSDIKIENSKGEYISVISGKISNTMKIYDIQYIYADEASRIEFTVDRDSKFIITAIRPDISVIGTDSLISAKGENISNAVLLPQAKKIELSSGGKNYTFEGYIYSDNEELMSLSGSTTGDTVISVIGNTIEASSTDNLNNVKSTTYVGNDTTEEKVTKSGDGSVKVTSGGESIVPPGTKEFNIVVGQRPNLSEALYFGKDYDRYQISNEKVASISGSVLTAEKAGTVTVYGLIRSGSDYVIDPDSKGITFTIKTVSVTTDRVFINKGKKVDISEYFSAGGIKPDYYTSSKPKIAKVSSDGIVTGKKNGTATISAYYGTGSGQVRYQIKVKVKAKGKK